MFWCLKCQVFWWFNHISYILLRRLEGNATMAFMMKLLLRLTENRKYYEMFFPVLSFWVDVIAINVTCKTVFKIDFFSLVHCRSAPCGQSRLTRLKTEKDCFFFFLDISMFKMTVSVSSVFCFCQLRLIGDPFRCTHNRMENKSDLSAKTWPHTSRL